MNSFIEPFRAESFHFPYCQRETVEKGDLVVVNTRTLQASKAKKRAAIMPLDVRSES